MQGHLQQKPAIQVMKKEMRSCKQKPLQSP